MAASAPAPASSPSPDPPPPSSPPSNVSSLTVNVGSSDAPPSTSASTSTSTTPTSASSTTAPLSASMIADYKQKLETYTSQETKDITAAVDILNTLMSTTISADILAQTKIGVLINQLRKYDNKEVAYTCRSLLERWKKAVQPVVSRTPSITQQIQKDKASKPTSTASSSSTSESKTSTPSTPTTPNGTLQKTPSGSVRRTTSSTTPASTTTTTATAPATSPTPASPSPQLLRTATPDPSKPITFPTFTSNGLTMGKTGDSFRNKIQQLLYEALFRAAPSASLCLETCVSLESAMYKHFGNKTDIPYKTRYREIAMNIKDDNNDLADRLFSGAITCERLVTMPVQEMASTQLQKQREEERVYARDAARSDWNRDKGTTEMFQCGKCKQKKCKYYQMQTRSADEPMTTFVTCVNCGHRWKC